MSTFTVKGRFDGAYYEVEVTGRDDEPVVGNRRVEALVREWSGQHVAATPTGPVYMVDGQSPGSILALLQVETSVLGVSGAAPKLEPARAGVIR